MRINFRQGIVRYQQDPLTANPLFLAKSSDDNRYVDLLVQPDPTVISFAHGAENYTYEESKTVRDAWGPFAADGVTQYLYWEINLVTGKINRGHTPFPLLIEPTQPPVERIGQCWFDTTENMMKVWTGNRWEVRIRVFAAIYHSSATLEPYPLYSQIGINNLVSPVKSGYIIFDSDGEPIRNRMGKFITSEHTLGTQTLDANSSTAFQLEGQIKSVIANEFIPRFYLVTLVGEDRVELANSTRVDRLVNGIVGEDFNEGENGRFITDGIVRNVQWNWPSDKVGKYLFCSPNGEVVLTPPTTGVSQIIGYVYDKKAIYLNIQLPFVL